MSKIDNVLKWLELSKVIMAPVLMAAGVPPAQATEVVALVGDAETSLGPGSGQQKLQAVLDGVTHSMNAAGANPIHVQAVQQAVASGLTTAIQVTNSVAAWHAASVAPAPASVPTASAAAGAGV